MIVVARDVQGLLDNISWQDVFGEVLISYWDPLDTNPTTGAQRASSVINYVNGLKIDFNLWSFQRYADVTGGPHPFAEFDAGYQVIIDKDDLTANLPAATYRAYIPARTERRPTCG